MNSEQRVRVCVRFRGPPIKCSLLRWNAQEVRAAERSYPFDAVIPPESTQEDMWEQINGYRMIETVMRGMHATIFAYGQTGSGKTYTMEGFEYSAERNKVKVDLNTPRERLGLIPRAIESLFDSLPSGHVTVRLSFLQIYNERIFDLFNPSTVDSLAGILQLLVTSEDHDGPLRRGRLALVDLAGSERQSETEVRGVNFREACAINQSLFVLRKVITTLATRDSKVRHVPYRESKLTSLLQHSLGGNSVTAMVACLNPDDQNFEDNVSTLKYASRANAIRNRAQVNVDPKSLLIQGLREEVAALRGHLDVAKCYIGAIPDEAVCWKKPTLPTELVGLWPDLCSTAASSGTLDTWPEPHSAPSVGRDSRKKMSSPSTSPSWDFAPRPPSDARATTPRIRTSTSASSATPRSQTTPRATTPRVTTPRGFFFDGFDQRPVRMEPGKIRPSKSGDEVSELALQEMVALREENTLLRRENTETKAQIAVALSENMDLRHRIDVFEAVTLEPQGLPKYLGVVELASLSSVHAALMNSVWNNR
eukprot:GEMP01020147.1.p1 GENE.GEMP01020147.1~~GEMP01020147.1.p1  ORF type:complete len:536 (+),score=126.00 GEMP01020147.1:91-1698(+)